MANKNKFSLSYILSNKKAALIISLVISIAVWAVVAFNSNDETREIKEIRVPIALRDSNNLTIYTHNEVKINVTVKGRRWVINKLTQEDIEVKADTSRLVAPGSFPVLINVPDSSSKNYTVVEVSLDEVWVKCDYFIEETFPLSVNIERVNLSKEATDNGLAIDTPVLNGADIAGVKVKGPATVINAIEKLVATVEETAIISKTASFPIKLIAFNESNQELDTQYCRFTNVNTSALIDLNMLSVNLPIVHTLKVDFEMSLTNVPEVFRNRVKFTPQSILLRGAAEQVNQFGENIRNLGEFDIRRINLANHQHETAFNIPSGVTVAEQVNSVTVDFDVSGLVEKTFAQVELKPANIVFKNVPTGFSFDANTQSQLSNLIVVGSPSTLNKLKAADVRFEIDLQNNSFVGAKNLVPAISFGGYTDVWAYFGPNNTTDYKIIVTGKEN